MPKILFVCTGNTCRSPMAEIIARDLLLPKKEGFSVSSRGINVLVPSRASDNAVKAVRLNYSLDLSPHISKQLAEGDLEQADMVFVMTAAHKQYLDMVYAGYATKVRLIASNGNDSRNIDDPYGKDLFVYKQCAEEIKKSIEELISGGVIL